MRWLRERFERRLLAGWYGPRPLLWAVPLAAVFWLLTALRRSLHRWRLLPVARLEVPVLVVGNVTAGGTGKTPLVDWLAGALRARGFTPGIVARGYGGSEPAVPVLVDADSDPTIVGDEPLLHARRGVGPVCVGRDRVAAGRALLAARPQVDLLICDDGLQHLRLDRDAELLVVDGERGFGNGWLLPAGPLREPSAPALARATAVVHTARGPAGACVMELQFEDPVQLSDGARRPLDGFRGAAVHAVAGIGNPERFFAALEARGLRIARHPRPDHAPLALQDLEFRDGAPVLITEKDAVKLPRRAPAGIWCVAVNAAFAPLDAARLLEALLVRLARRDGRRR